MTTCTFGDSKYSIGIQLADICTFLIGRHLAGYEDTEHLYKQLSTSIFKGAVEPKPDEMPSKREMY